MNWQVDMNSLSAHTQRFNGTTPITEVTGYWITLLKGNFTVLKRHFPCPYCRRLNSGDHLSSSWIFFCWLPYIQFERGTVLLMWHALANVMNTKRLYFVWYIDWCTSCTVYKYVLWIKLENHSFFKNLIMWKCWKNPEPLLVSTALNPRGSDSFSRGHQVFPWTTTIYFVTFQKSRKCMRP